MKFELTKEVHMMMTMRRLSVPGLIATVAVSFAFPFAAGPRAAWSAGGVAGQKDVMKTIPHAVIHFGTSSSLLSEADHDTLRKMVASARAEGETFAVAIAAWSDKNLPAKGENLAPADRDLAWNRADAISTVLKSELFVPDVETYNMAEGTHWIARVFHTSDAELKSMFGERGAELPVTNAELQIIRIDGGPSDAVVVVKRKAMLPGTSTLMSR